ncbi:MAG: GAF domain-containing protein [Kouleothrix sp.]|nr:GAF domain-containing protein [Kouleothrix sp.]
MRGIIEKLSRPVVLVWGMALFASVAVLAAFGLPPIGVEAWRGAVLVGALLVLGDLAGVELEDRISLTPEPALLIAGIVVAGWPLLPLAVVVGTSVSAVLRQRPPQQAFAEAGARWLAVALIAPIYQLTQPYAAPAFSTPIGVLGLLLIGAIAYAIAVVLGSGGADQGGLLARWRARLGSMRWYVLAMIPLGGLLGTLWTVSPWAFLLGLVPLAVAQHSFRSEVALRRTTREFEQLAIQRQALATRVERLLALTTAMIGTLDVQTMLEILCKRLAALLDAPAGWVVLLDEAGRPQLTTSHNLPESNVQLAIAEPQSYGPLLARRRVLLVTDERCQALAPLTPDGDPASWSAVLSIPLLGEQQTLGAICLAFDRLRGLDVDEQRVLTSFAHQAAVSVENARLFDELRRKQAELIQSSKLAAVGTFAAGIAHEFNNLLGSMLGYAELGYHADDVEEKNHSLDVVMHACRRGRSITRGLLTFARRQEHRRALGDITDAIDETLTLVELDLNRARIAIVRQIEPVPPTICDLGQLSQVVLNLITNARDAMKPQGGTLTVGLRERRGMIELSVADTGSGIPDEIRDKIFEPFVTTKGALGGSQTPGTGLGLSVSYGIVQEHGGTIEVDSDVGRGTTMIVRVPIVDQPVERAIAVGE